VIDFRQLAIRFIDDEILARIGSGVDTVYNLFGYIQVTGNIRYKAPADL